MRKVLSVLLFIFACGVMAAEFVHGFYMIPTSDKHFELLKSLGITHVHNYLNAYSEKGLEAMQLQLDTAQKHGLKVMFNLIRGGVQDEPDGLEKIRAVVRRFKDHPALGFWYLFDEPHGEKLAKQLPEIYAMIKQETPDIPVALCLAQNADWRKFTAPCDILMGDIYPVNNEPFPEAPLFKFTNFMNDLSQFDKPVIPIPQFMSWRCYPKVSKGYDSKTLRYPNAAELRYFFYATLAMGNTTGVFWYSFHDIQRDNNPGYFEEMRPVLLEFRSFTDLLKEPRQAKVFKWARDNNLYIALLDGKYLVAVNNWPVKQRVSRWTENIINGDYDLVPWGPTRQTKSEIRNNKLTLGGFIEPWESMIWELKEVKK